MRAYLDGELAVGIVWQGKWRKMGIGVGVRLGFAEIGDERAAYRRP